MFSGPFRALATNAAGVESRLNEVLIDRYQDGENAGIRRYVKGVIWWTASAITRWKTNQSQYPGTAAGVNGGEYCSVKIEGRQRSPAYVSQVAKVGVRLSTVVRPIRKTSYRKARDGDARVDVRRHADHPWRVSRKWQ